MILERETGLEPATSSLGIQPFIESKSLARFCCEFLNLQYLAESAFFKSVISIEAQTRQVLSVLPRALHFEVDPSSTEVPNVLGDGG